MTASNAADAREGTRGASARARGALTAFWNKAYRDGLTGLAAMVAYNLLLSLLPLTLVALFLFGQVSGDAESSVIRDVHRILPSTEGSDIQGLLDGLRRSSTKIGIAALVASVWVGASFWGAIDTAFCRIYHYRCRTWLEQKRFALAMLLVVLLLLAATIAVPALQSVVVRGADELPFGLDAGRAVYAFTLVLGSLLLFGTLCLVYRLVPNGPLPWRGVWPGAAAATLAMLVVDYAFPVYLSSGSVVATFRGVYVFVLIVLIWFYVIAIVLLGGAVVNALRLGED